MSVHVTIDIPSARAADELREAIRARAHKLGERADSLTESAERVADLKLPAALESETRDFFMAKAREYRRIENELYKLAEDINGRMKEA